MKFDRLKDPALCAAKTETRYAIAGVALVQHQDHFYLAATDGRKASLIRAEREECDEVDPAQAPVYHREAFTAARKAAGRRNPDASVHLNGKAVVENRTGGSRTEFERLDSRFPDVFSCMPKGTPAFQASFNVEHLAELAKAMGTEHVTLSFFASDHGRGQQPVRVDPLSLDGDAAVDGSFGVFMPLSED